MEGVPYEAAATGSLVPQVWPLSGGGADLINQRRYDMERWTTTRVKLADRIVGILPARNGSGFTTLVLEESDVRVRREYVEKHTPVVGGFYIQYEDDGYESFCPGDVFLRTHVVAGDAESPVDTVADPTTEGPAEDAIPPVLGTD